MKDALFHWLIAVSLWLAGFGLYSLIKAGFSVWRKKEPDINSEYPLKLFVAIYAGFNRATNQTTSRTSTIAASNIDCAKLLAQETALSLYPAEEFVQVEWHVDEVKVPGTVITASIIDAMFYAENAKFCPLNQEYSTAESEVVELPSTVHGTTTDGDRYNDD